MIAVPLDRKNPRAWPGSPIRVFSHARLSARRPIKPTSTKSEADPVKMDPDSHVANESPEKGRRPAT